MKNFFLISMILCSTPIFSHIELRSIEQKESLHLTAYTALPEKETFPLVIVLQNSVKESILPLLETFEPLARELGVGLIGIEKDGVIGPNQIDPLIYNQHNFRTQRIKNHLFLINKIREGLIEGWNGNILFLGGSEGGKIAFELAKDTPETGALLSFAAGGGLAPRDEVFLGAERQLMAKGYSKFSMIQQLLFFGLQVKEMLRHPTPGSEFWEYSYLWWAEYLGAPHLAKVALELNCPILYVHGVEDEFIPIESADLFAKSFETEGKTNLTYLRLDGFGHDLFLHDSESLQEVTKAWLIEVLSGL